MNKNQLVSCKSLKKIDQTPSRDTRSSHKTMKILKKLNVVNKKYISCRSIAEKAIDKKMSKSNDCDQSFDWKCEFSDYFFSCPNFIIEKEKNQNQKQRRPLDIISEIRKVIEDRINDEGELNLSEDSDNGPEVPINNERVRHLREDSFKSEVEEGDSDLIFDLNKYYALRDELRQSEMENNKNKPIKTY